MYSFIRLINLGLMLGANRTALFRVADQADLQRRVCDLAQKDSIQVHPERVTDPLSVARHRQRSRRRHIHLNWRF